MELGKIETYRGVVRPAELDHMGHMNVQFYTGRFDEATWHLFSQVGLTLDYMNREMRGMAAVDQHTQYKAEVMVGDLLVIRSEMIEVRQKTLRFRHYMYGAEDGVLKAQTELVGAHLDRKIRRACAFSDNIRQKAEALIASS